METEQYLDHLARCSEQLADAALAAGTDAAVPTCPGWTVADLVDHMLRGDRWARVAVEQAEQGDISRVVAEERDEALAGTALVDAYRAAATALVEALGSADLATSAWTFSANDRTVAFWLRRRTHETAVHRYDADIAAGTATPVDTALAVDGIDEFLNVMLPRRADKLAELDGTIHLHCTDADGEWLVTGRHGEIRVTEEHAKGDVAARGGASDLLLFLWGRVPADALEVFGDADLLDRFRQSVTV